MPVVSEFTLVGPEPGLPESQFPADLRGLFSSSEHALLACALAPSQSSLACHS